MPKVEGSNPGVSILKFGLFQFSHVVAFGKNNNLGILVALLVLNDLISVNAKSYSEYIHGLLMDHGFEYCIDPKDHNSEEEYKAIAIAIEGPIWPKL